MNCEGTLEEAKHVTYSETKSVDKTLNVKSGVGKDMGQCYVILVYYTMGCNSRLWTALNTIVQGTLER